MISDSRYRATGFGVLNLFSCGVGGLTIYAGGMLRDANVNVSRLFEFSAVGLLACAVLFGVTPADMFPKIHADVEEEVLARAAKLYEILEKKTGKDAMRKKELLNVLLERAITRLITAEGV